MNTPIVMLLDVVLWSFGVSAAILAGLMVLDAVAARREAKSGPQLDDTRAMLTRIQQPAPRRSANHTAARAA